MIPSVVVHFAQEFELYILLWHLYQRVWLHIQDETISTSSLINGMDCDKCNKLKKIKLWKKTFKSSNKIFCPI